MDLRLNEDELAVDEVFAAFFAAEAPIEVVRAAEPLGHDAELWGRFVATGAPGMALPIAAGGGGAPLTIAAVVAHQLGRSIAPVPFVEHTVAGRAVARWAPDDESVPEIAAGGLVATLGFASDLVPAGAVAEVIVHAGDDDGVHLARSAAPGAAEPNAPRLPLARRRLDGAAVAATGWRRVAAEWQALMAIALCGLGGRALEIGVDYVKDRHQFGVAVGTFQGIQHGLADASTNVEGATHLAQRAVCALDADADDAETMAGMAFLFAAEAAQGATAAALQYHGGYGYAEEYDIQLYYRRARGWALQYGDPAVEYQRLAALLLPPAEVA